MDETTFRVGCLIELKGGPEVLKQKDIIHYIFQGELRTVRLAQLICEKRDIQIPKYPPAFPQGTWPADDLRRAFVAGAKWWEFFSRGATMWSSDQNLAENEAETRYPEGKVPSHDGGDGGKTPE